MADKERIYQTPLRDDWANDLLDGRSDHPLYGTVAERLKAAREELADAVVEARKRVSESSIGVTLASAFARQINRRGESSLNVNDDGQVMLEVQYKGVTKAAPQVRPSPLPPLATLRAEAQALGINTKPFGRSKRKLQKAILKAEAQVSKPEATPEPVAPEPLVAPSKNGELPWGDKSELPEDVAEVKPEPEETTPEPEEELEGGDPDEFDDDALEALMDNFGDV